jgi:hypothetical protein
VAFDEADEFSVGNFGAQLLFFEVGGELRRGGGF